MQRTSELSLRLARPRRLTVGTLGVGVALLVLAGCGGKKEAKDATSAPTLTAARIPSRVARVLVAQKGKVAMVSRGGCVASVGSGVDDTGEFDEMRIRCPKPERLAEWFTAFEAETGKMPVERVPEDEDDDDIPIPTTEFVTASGEVLRITQNEDAARVASRVGTLQQELAVAEMPHPGPASAGGWQMMRVSGPAHVFFGGAPTTGVLDARMSTTGQYLCEFNANTESGPLRATKSGWITQTTASRAIDDVLSPFQSMGAGERRLPTFVAAFARGAESQANPASTAAVFERFAKVQDALGDACLPELEAPSTDSAL